MLLEECFERDVQPAGDVWGIEDHTLDRVERAGDSDADPQVMAVSGRHLLNGLDDAVEDSLRTLVGRRGDLRLSFGMGVIIGEVCRPQVCAPKIDGNDGHHVGSIT